MSNNHSAVLPHSKKTAAMTKQSRVIQFLAENMRIDVPQKKAAKLELALNSEDKIQKEAAQLETERLLKKLIMSKADPIALLAIKLHADIYKPTDCPETTPFITLDESGYGYDFHRTDAADVFREIVFEISKKNIEYFMTAYTKAVGPSEIQPSTLSHYETVSRKLRFVSENISRVLVNNELKSHRDAIWTLLHRTPTAYESIMLTIIDLHYKITANDYEKKRIRGVMMHWQSVLRWEAKHLKKHAKKPNEFFEIADDVITDKLGFKSIEMNKITSVKDIAEALDNYYNYQFELRKRLEIIDQIEKKWRAWKSKMQPSAKKQRPKNCFSVNEQCYEFLTNKSISYSQPAAITKVVEHLGKNVKAVLVETQALTGPHDSTPAKDKKKVVVHTSSVPIRKIDSLRKKLKLSRSKLLELAVYDYMKAENISIEDKKQQQARDGQTFETNKAQDLSMGLGSTHPSTESTQKPTEQLTVELQQPIEPTQSLVAEQQAAHLQHQTSTSEQQKASQEALGAIKKALDTTPTSVHNNEIVDSEQLRNQQLASDDVYSSKNSRCIENQQSISNDELLTEPEKSPQTTPDQSLLPEQYAPHPKPETLNSLEAKQKGLHEAFLHMHSLENIRKRR